MPLLPSDLINIGKGLAKTLIEPSDLPETLYHYTTASGLLGILGGKEVTLWASRVLSLNDRAEISHGMDLGKQLLNSFHTGGYDWAEGVLLEAIQDSMPTSPEESGGIEWDTYVMCFSERDDLLAQWIHYGAGGGGYAIGLDSARLRDAPIPGKPKQPGQLSVGRVIYSLDRQREIVRALFDRFAARIRQDPPRVAVNWIVVGGLFWIWIMHLSVFFKASGHSAEEEWRAYFTSFKTDGLPDVKPDLAGVKLRAVCADATAFRIKSPGGSNYTSIRSCVPQPLSWRPTSQRPPSVQSTRVRSGTSWQA
jgi:hypothetical protein